MNRNYGGAIWTNHALARMKERGIKQGDAWATWNNPDSKRQGSVTGSYVYYKTYGNQRMEVVSKKNDRGEWVILSVWSRPRFSNYHEFETGNKTWNKILEGTLNLLFGWAKKKQP